MSATAPPKLLRGATLRTIGTIAVGMTLAAVAVGCQLVLGIDPDVPILDGGAAGGGAGGATLSCADAGALLCDDFEEPTIDPARWQHVNALGATASIDTYRAYGNSQRSLHAHADPVSQPDAGIVSGMVEHLSAQPGALPLPPHFFVRFFAYVESPAADSIEPEILVNLQQQNIGGMQLYVQGGLLSFTSWANVPVLNVPSEAAFSLDAWHCIEWEIDATPGTTSGTMSVWFDGGAVASLDRDDVLMPAYDSLAFGIAFGSPPVQVAHDVWVDDVRVDAQKIGCR